MYQDEEEDPTSTLPPLPQPHLRKILRALKRRGYTLSSSALPTLSKLYHTHVYAPDTLPTFITWLLDRTSRVTHDSIITNEGLEALLDEGGSNVGVGEIIEVVDAFDIYCCGDDGVRGRRRRRGSGMGNVVGDARMKGEMFRRRFEVVMGRVLQHQMFCKGESGVVGRDGGSLYRLIGVDSLDCGEGVRYVLGMLVEREEGVFWLEDLNGMVKLDLGHVLDGDGVLPGLYCEGVFVIVQGDYVREGENGEEGVLRVSLLGMPPMAQEEWVTTGGDVERGVVERLKSEPQKMELFEKYETENENAMFVLLSDVHLDKPSVLSGLRRLFSGYMMDDAPPTCVVMMGNFLSHPFGQNSGDVANLAACFTRLGELIEDEFPQLLTDTLFVLVPGPNDAGCSGILPRPPLPKCVTKGFLDVFPRTNPIKSMSNPCRIRYCTQEVVLFREDLLHKVVRHCALPIPEDKARGSLLLETIVHQAHLVPLPPNVRPILWAHDVALLLVPNPTLLVLGDTGEQYSYTYEKTRGLNPGCFARDYSFAVYLPSAKRAEKCSLSVLVNDNDAAADDNDSSHQEEHKDLARIAEQEESSELEDAMVDGELLDTEDMETQAPDGFGSDEGIGAEDTGDSPLIDADRNESSGIESEEEKRNDGYLESDDEDVTNRDEVESEGEDDLDEGREKDLDCEETDKVETDHDCRARIGRGALRTNDEEEIDRGTLKTDDEEEIDLGVLRTDDEGT